MREAKETQLLRDIGQRVRSHRQARRLTLRTLGLQTKLSERFLSDVEAGRANISILNLAEIAQVLRVSLPQLLTERGEEGLPPGVWVLWGLRGAGKSTVGKALAKKLDVDFFELDQLVEREAGMRLSELFAIHGEDYFRRLELSVLERFLAENSSGVLATGGGLVTSPKAMALCQSHTRTVWLKAKPEEHWERVVSQGDLRPMQDRPEAMAELRRRLREREPLYKKADFVCSTSERSVDEIVDELSKRVAQVSGSNSFIKTA